MCQTASVTQPDRLCHVMSAVVGKVTTFDLWPLPLGGGAWGAGVQVWNPETPASYESLPAPLATQIPTLFRHTSGGRGRGGALILDRCRAFDLFASVDAHLCMSGITCIAKTKYRNFETNIPRKGILGSQSQFPHSCVCERIIYSHDRSAYSAGGNM